MHVVGECCVSVLTVASQLHTSGLLLHFQDAKSLMFIPNQAFCALTASLLKRQGVVDRIDWTRLLNRQVTAVTGVPNSACVRRICQQPHTACLKRTPSADNFSNSFGLQMGCVHALVVR